MFNFIFVFANYFRLFVLFAISAEKKSLLLPFGNIIHVLFIERTYLQTK